MINEIEITEDTSPRKHLLMASMTGDDTENPWTAINKELSEEINYESYTETVQLIRFFYRTEPLIATVVNKLVEIGTNDLIISRNRLSENEHRAFLYVKDRLLKFAGEMAQEYLLSGLVAPEIGFGKADIHKVRACGIKKYPSLTVPQSMFVRDPKTIVIYSSIIADKPSYFIKIPSDMVEFIKNKGVYSGGKEDKKLYAELKVYYPEFVAEILKGSDELLLTNPNILRRKYLPDNPYPVPYVSPVLDALQHKRKMRRMDYSLMDKIISAILHIKVGSDEFPITESEEDEEFLASLKQQLMFRRRNNDDVEKLFQLLTSHVVDIDWVFPRTDILLNNAKYDDINLEILFGLGFPQSLITGETRKSGSADVEMSLVSPIKTMENFRREITPVLQQICYDMSEKNNMTYSPVVSFAPINLHKFTDFLEGLTKLYDISSLSRSTFAKALGQDFESEVEMLEAEKELLESKGLPVFGEAPYSRNPGSETNTPEKDEKEEGDDTTKKE